MAITDHAELKQLMVAESSADLLAQAPQLRTLFVRRRCIRRRTTQAATAGHSKLAIQGVHEP